MSDDDRTKEERDQALGKSSFSKLLMSGLCLWITFKNNYKSTIISNIENV